MHTEIDNHVLQEVEYDSDGDAVVIRKLDFPEDVLVIEHDLATNLASVGRQETALNLEEWYSTISQIHKTLSRK